MSQRDVASRAAEKVEMMLRRAEDEFLDRLQALQALRAYLTQR
jgi:ABC-type transport system involved in cytochrome bd biosynthesis fused ATPase/permease subunit